MSTHEHGPVRSITDLARIADVSISTVSRALTGKGKLNQATRDRVRALAEEHNFRLNVAAQNLRLRRTGAVAVLLPLGHEEGQHLSDPFFAAMLSYLADELTARGFDLLLSRVIPTGDDWLFNFVKSGRTDGVIIIGQSDQNAVLNRKAERYQPLVVWGAHSDENRYITVGTDNEEGGRLAARHLIEQGCRRLAFFGNITVPEFAARYRGFLSALPDDVRAEVIQVPMHITPERSLEQAGDFFRSGNRPDGIFTASDVVAMSAISAATERGLSVPGDVAVVGFDDILLAQMFAPAISTIRQDIAAGARALVDMLFRRISDDGEEAHSVYISPTLVTRESSRRLDR